jgi:hypothetical protein
MPLAVRVNKAKARVATKKRKYAAPSKNFKGHIKKR